MRKTLRVTIEADGRDQGKVFLLTEMPAMKAEKWAMRALMAAAASGVEIPSGEPSFIELATLSLKALAGVNWEVAEPLMDELMTCVQFVDPANQTVARPLHPDAPDIEEIATLLKLQAEVFTLHTGFSFGGLKSKSTSEKSQIAS